MYMREGMLEEGSHALERCLTEQQRSWSVHTNVMSMQTGRHTSDTHATQRHREREKLSLSTLTLLLGCPACFTAVPSLSALFANVTQLLQTAPEQEVVFAAARALRAASEQLFEVEKGARYEQPNKQVRLLPAVCRGASGPVCSVVVVPLLRLSLMRTPSP